MKLTIVGLGPGHADDLTRRAWNILQNAPEVYLRTARHPVVDALPQNHQSFDALYDAAEDFQTLYETITEQVIELAGRPNGVIYAVPGHPLVGEQTVTRLMDRARELSIPVEIIDGLSFIEPSLAMIGIDGMAGMQIHDAAEIAAMHHPPLNPDQPALIGQLYSAPIASDVKLTLMNQYPDAHPVVLLHGAGLPDALREDLPLYEIDRSPHLAHLTTLFVPPLDIASSMERFQETIAHLRAPEGCPWDRKQTHQSLRPYLMEESAEVLDALDSGDMESLCEELGDLLLQVVLHSQVAIDEGSFTMADIVAGINAKIIRRHPHVWGDVEVNDVDDLKRVWQQQKDAEKSHDLHAESKLDGVPKALPALAQATAYQKKAAKVGFDWPSIEPVIDKVMEEIDEIKTATTEEERSSEFGDLLFAVVNWARWHDIDAETVLRQTNGRFRARFAYIEAQARATGRDLPEMSLDEMDALWEEAKANGN